MCTAVNLGIAAQGVPVMPRGAVLLLHGGCLCTVGFAGANIGIPGRTWGTPSTPEASPRMCFSPWQLTIVAVAADTSRVES